MAEPQITYRVAAHLSSKGDLAKSMGQKAAAVSGLSAKFDMASSRAMAFGSAQTAAVGASAAAIGKYSAAIGAMAVGGGIGLMVAKGVELNIGQERLQNTIAGTLQLFNHSAGATDQLGQNIKVAGAALQALTRIADESPGELKDIQNLFTNMLPGARAATADMKRILDLSQNVALFTPTFGGDFSMAGSQISRMLTGGAGAEMEVWRTLQPVLLEVGKEMDKVGQKGKKIFDKATEGGEKMTMAFNKLTKEDRLAVLEKSLSKGGPALAKMYAGSWEGASAAAVSSMRKVAGTFTQPLFNATKAALLKAGGAGGPLAKDTQSALLTGASKLGGMFAKSLVKVLDSLARGMTYVSQNWEAISNKVYHGMQIGAGMIKAAFAFGFARMMVGAAAIGAAMAAKTVSGVTRGVSKGYGMTKAGVKGIGDFAGGMKRLVDTVTKGNPISNAMGLVTSVFKFGSGMAMVLPMLLIAGAALAVMAVPLLAVAGIAAYMASKWDELSLSIVNGFKDGSVTLRPLIVAAMVLWEKMKEVGKAFIGGQTGATLMQKAINFAAGAVDLLSKGVVMLMKFAAGFIQLVAGSGTGIMNGTDSQGRHAAIAVTAQDRTRIEDVLQSGLTDDLVTAQKIVERRKEAGVYELDSSEKATALSKKLYEVADRMESIGLKNLNLEDIDDITKRAEASVAGVLGAAGRTNTNARGAQVNIGHLTQQFDLRGEDPDRAMVAWVEPIERLARTPGGSTLDVGGF
jgi:hypothetical protein